MGPGGGGISFRNEAPLKNLPRPAVPTKKVLRRIGKKQSSGNSDAKKKKVYDPARNSGVSFHVTEKDSFINRLCGHSAMRRVFYSKKKSSLKDSRLAFRRRAVDISSEPAEESIFGLRKPGEGNTRTRGLMPGIRGMLLGETQRNALLKEVLSIDCKRGGQKKGVVSDKGILAPSLRGVPSQGTFLRTASL